MQVQKVRLGSDRYSHIVIGDDYLPIKPILSFIRYLDNTDKSPHTIRAYANHLKLYWDYLTENGSGVAVFFVFNYNLFRDKVGAALCGNTFTQ